MRKSILYISLFFSTIAYSQNVGINTNDPKRNLDVNGNLRVKSLENKTNNSDFRSIVAQDKSNGNIDKISFPSLEQSETKNVEIKKSIYISNTAITANQCNCGDITFYLKNEDNKAYFKLNSDKTFGDLNANDFTLSYGVKTWAGGNNATNSGSYTYKNVLNRNLYKSTFTKETELDPDAFPTNNKAEVRIYTIVLPKQDNLYRLTISRLSNTSSSAQYALICEKFYIQTIENETN